MAQAGLRLLNAADNQGATIQQRNALAVAFNTSMASGSVIKYMAFRKHPPAQQRLDVRLEKELCPWQTVSFYDKKAREVSLASKTRSVSGIDPITFFLTATF